MKKYHDWINTGLIILLLVLGLVGGILPANRTLGSINIDANSIGAPSSGLWTAFDNLFTGELRVNASSTFAGAGTTTIQGIVSYNGLWNRTLTGACADATTTVVSVLNPFGATSTVSWVALEGRMGTTSGVLLMGTSTGAAINENLSNAVHPRLFNATISTSSRFSLTNLRLGVASTSSGTPEEFATRVQVGPTEYVVVGATGTAASANDLLQESLGEDNTSNTFQCNYAVNFSAIPQP